METKKSYLDSELNSKSEEHARRAGTFEAPEDDGAAITHAILALAFQVARVAEAIYKTGAE